MRERERERGREKEEEEEEEKKKKKILLPILHQQLPFPFTWVHHLSACYHKMST